MSDPGIDPARRAIGEEAAKWSLVVPTADVSERAAFVAWLKRSPLHVEEFLFATATLKALQGRAQADSGEIDRIVEEALASGGGSNVVALHSADTEAARPAPRFWSGVRIAAAIVVALIASVCALLAYNRLVVHVESYATGVGEQRTIRLSDGSLAYLNARSQLDVRYSRKLREIELGEGDAIFQVAREPDRPFDVRVGEAVIRAVGTRFNVSRRGAESTVSVLEGQVQVAAQPVTGPSVNVKMGEQARIEAGRITRRTNADMGRAVAWRERRLVFRDDRLEDIVDEFARYSPRHIRLEGYAAREQRITGTFDADDPAALVLFLEGVDGLSVEQAGVDFIVRSR